MRSRRSSRWPQKVRIKKKTRRVCEPIHNESSSKASFSHHCELEYLVEDSLTYSFHEHGVLSEGAN